MRKVAGIGLIVFFTAGCEMNTSTTKAKVDSAMLKMDSSLEKIGDKADAAWDSTKLKAKELKEDIDSAFVKDTTK